MRTGTKQTPTIPPGRFEIELDASFKYWLIVRYQNGFQTLWMRCETLVEARDQLDSIENLRRLQQLRKPQR